VDKRAPEVKGTVEASGELAELGRSEEFGNNMELR
jgi:hypothetical protein